MRCSEIDGVVLWDSWSAQYEGNIDVFLKSATLPWRKSMLTNMESIVRGIDNVSIVENSLFGELVDYPSD